MIRKWLSDSGLVLLAVFLVSWAVLGSVGCLPAEFIQDVIQASQPEAEDPWDELIDDIADIIHAELGEQ